MLRLPLIDRYLARSIAVPLFGSLVLAAMLLILDKMLRLFQYVVDAGGPVSVVWRMLANLLPEYLSLGIPIGLMLGILLAFRKLALSSELDALRGIGVGYGRLLRIPYAFAIPLMILNLFIVGYLEPWSHYKYEGLRFDLKSGALGAAIKVGEFNQLGHQLTLGSTAARRRGPSCRAFSSRWTTSRDMSVAATAERGRFLSTDDPDTILFRLVKGRMIQNSPKFTTPRTLSFETYDLPVSLPAIDQFRGRGGTSGSDELYLHELARIGYGGGTADRQQRLGGAGNSSIPAGRGHHDADAAAPCGRASGTSEAQFLVARNLPRDRDRGRLSQGQSICGAGRRPGPDRAHRRLVGSVAGAGGAYRLDVPCARPQAGRPADRSARAWRREKLAGGAFAVSEGADGMISLRLFPSRAIAAYTVRLFLTRSFAVLLALVLILMMLDLLGESGKILAVPGNGDAELWRYVGLRIPLLIARFLPFSVLLGTLIAFVGLNQHSEVVAMKAAGVSAHQMLAPLIIASIVIAGALFAFNETIVVKSTRVVTAWTDNDYKPIPPDTGIVDNVWLMDGEDLIRAGHVAGSGNRFHADNVRIYDRTGGALERVIRADRATPVPGSGKWLLDNVQIYDANMNVVVHKPRLLALDGVTPQQLTLAKVDPTELDYFTLKQRIGELERAGRPTDEAKAGLAHKISGPLSTVLMPLLAAVAAFGLARSGQVLVRACLGMALGFAYFVADNFSLAMGNVGTYPPLVAAWAPFLLFLLIGETVLMRTEE